MFAYRAGKNVEIFRGRPLKSRKLVTVPKEAVEGTIPIEDAPLPGFGIYEPKDATNLGHLIRSAHAFAIPFVFQIGASTGWHSIKTDTTKAIRWLVCGEYGSFEQMKREFNHVPIIGVEIDPDAKNVTEFKAPRDALYLFGREDEGIPPNVIAKLDEVVQIPTVVPLNVGVTSAILMFHWCLTNGFPVWRAKGRNEQNNDA